MRLIDADNLFLPMAQEVNRLAERIEKTIDRQESVEAIPIEWIVEWEKREENYYRYKDMVRFLIEDWRNEQVD